MNINTDKTMKSIAAQWIETKVRYEKTMDDGMQKQVSEKYVVDAYTFAEAEEAITKEMLHYVSGEFSVKAVKSAPYSEVFFTDNDSGDKFYKAKLQFITIDEKTGKERKSNTQYLVQASTFGEAVKNIEAVMNATMIDYTIVGLAETGICDVFRHKPKEVSE